VAYVYDHEVLRLPVPHTVLRGHQGAASRLRHHVAVGGAVPQSALLSAAADAAQDGAQVAQRPRR